MFYVLASILLAAAAASVPQENAVPDDARATIAAANAAWIPALEKQDAAAIAAPYAEDGIFVAPVGTVVRGRAGVAQLMKDRFSQMGKVRKGELVQDGMTRQGSFIYEWGHATLETERDGVPARSGGRYLTVWQKNAAGRWEIVRNLYLPD